MQLEVIHDENIFLEVNCYINTTRDSRIRVGHTNKTPLKITLWRNNIKKFTLREEEDGIIFENWDT